MQIQIFKAEGRIFGVVGEGDEGKLPARLGPWAAFKTVDLVRGQTQPGLHVEECLDDLERYGVHVTDAHTRITEQALTDAD